MLVDNGDMDGFVSMVSTLYDSDILLFPEYALAELLSYKPSMVAEAAKSGTVLATPSTLIAMLEWVRLEWQRAEALGRLAETSDDLSKALKAFATRYAEMGKRIGGVRQIYNSSLGTWADVEKTAGLAVEAACQTTAQPEKLE